MMSRVKLQNHAAKVTGMNGPFLVGERVYLRALSKHDLGTRYFQWFNDQESDILTDHAIWPNTKKRMEKFLERVTRGGNDLVLAIIVQAGGRHIGNVGLHRISWIHRRAEMAILLGEERARNHGYGPEAMRMLAAYAFNKLNLNRIGLGVSAENRGAIRAYKKAGFVEEGCFEQHFIRGGRSYATVRMRLLRSEFVRRFADEGRWFTMGIAAGRAQIPSRRSAKS